MTSSDARKPGVSEPEAAAHPDRFTVTGGVHTLDGNSNDYRYIQVRRTLIYIEQTIKAALDQSLVVAGGSEACETTASRISGILRELWSRGELVGETEADAFTVECRRETAGSGDDRPEDVLEASITVRLPEPVEVVGLTVRRKAEGGG